MGSPDPLVCNAMQAKSNVVLLSPETTLFLIWNYMLLLRDGKNRLATETAGWLAGLDGLKGLYPALCTLI